MVIGPMRAIQPGIKGAKQFFNPPVDRLDVIDRDIAARNAALIRNDRNAEPGCSQRLYCFTRSRYEPHPLRISIIRNIDDERAVAIKKNGANCCYD